MRTHEPAGPISTPLVGASDDRLEHGRQAVQHGGVKHCDCGIVRAGVAVLALLCAPKAALAAEPKPETTKHPRLVLAGGPTIGPHRFGIETCQDDGRCDTAGSFVGIGGTVELRARAWRPLYAHARGLFVGNVITTKPPYSGLLGAGLGFGAYGRWAMARAEYLLVFPVGDGMFPRPFADEDGMTDTWGHHAGLVSAGVRYKPLQRIAFELWGGLMIGPKSTRAAELEETEESTLLSFLVGLTLSYDVLP